MAEGVLHDCRVLVVEDEYMLADELRSKLEDAGAIVLGPVGKLEDAFALIAAEPHIDGAILDANLRGETSFGVAHVLAEPGVPLVFTTGYDASVFPSRFRQILRCEKPVSVAKIAQAIGRVIHA